MLLLLVVCLGEFSFERFQRSLFRLLEYSGKVKHVIFTMRIISCYTERCLSGFGPQQLDVEHMLSHSLVGSTRPWRGTKASLVLPVAPVVYLNLFLLPNSPSPSTKHQITFCPQLIGSLSTRSLSAHISTLTLAHCVCGCVHVLMQQL